MKQLKMYGTSWCSDCHRSKAFLEKHNIKYSYIDIEAQPEQVKVVERINNGLRRVPTIILPNGTVLVEPKNQELKEALNI